MAQGCDYSFDHPTVSSLKAAGYKFACRYVGGSAGKRITSVEARNLWNAGIDVVTNFEGFPDNALGGHSKGVSDARTADSQHKAAGGPSNKPIYFSVDFDAQPHQAGTILAYFQGVASVIGSARTGVYGGIRIVSYLLDNGVCKYGWQTYAWSRGSWDNRAQIQQYHNNVKIGGGVIDLDRSMHADFGGWHGPIETIGTPPGQGALGPVTSGTWDPSPALSHWVDDMSDVIRVFNQAADYLVSIRK